MIARLTLSLALGGTAFAGFTPVLNLIEPRGGQRGTEVEMHFHGERLDGLQELLAYEPGIEVRSIAVENDKHATAKIFIKPDAPLGEHGLRVRTAGGVSYLRSFFVGQFPVVGEVDPNDKPEQAQRIELNTTVQGVAKQEDVDYYVCSLKKGQRFTAEVEAMRLGRTMFDVYVAIVDPKGFEIASCDDAPLLRTDAFVSTIIPEDGDYRVLVREAAYEGNDACQYRVSIGTFPRPTAAFPSGAKPGETVEFKFIGDPVGEFSETIAIPLDADGRFPLFPTRDGLSVPSPVWIKVSPLNHVAETEPNAGPKQASTLPELPCAAHGVIGESGDVDFFKFTAKKGENLTVKVLARDIRSPLDAVLSIRDAKGKNLATNDDQGGPDSILQWAAPEDGEYLAVVRDQLQRGGSDFTYRLEITRREPVVAATLPVVERDNSQKWKVINVPRGNRYAAVINVTRENVGCDLALSAGNLPAGVTMTAPVFHRSVNATPVVFEAAADATVAGSLHRFNVKSAGDAPPVSGPLRDTVHHVEINNQGAYHSAESDRIPVAVIEEAPFRLELEAPAVPIVKNGSMHLKVRAQRSEGYNEAINLRFLWNPPGIGTPATITMPGDQSEALYEVNANGDAAPGEWQICILGEANTPKGPVLVSTSLVTLKIAEPYLGMAIDMAATEQGKPTTVLCKVDFPGNFTGNATAELMGLPHGAKTQPVSFPHGQAEVHFPVEIAPDATVGKHTALFCRVTVPENGATILHQVGQGGTLRIDKPAENTPPPQPVAQTDAPVAPAAAPAEKPLSRLEQLRQKKN
ncbi:PPC domain-containing protein [Luteolibacter flavescens]|uniref:PPC domain-containing protein n=1 Tax=Luteolibacter flavescens TaxID=1859460 RepID=A0ABT3FIE0_9BACT|nr:PPC domain-containing protein [Luteolibacter flavescens]MCW1883338.1 PPC domain-containing protein [Luteolibacter flavescens]